MKKEVKVSNALVPIIGLFLIMIYGLIIQPKVLQLGEMPLEMIFMFAAAIGTANLYFMGYTWDEIQESMVKKITQGLPAMMILFSIGVVQQELGLLVGQFLC